MPSDSESKPPKKAKVLDLIEDQPKTSRRERQRETAAKQATPAPAPVVPVKKAALDIFEDEGKKKKSTGIRKTERSGKSVVPTISKVLDKEDADLALPPLPPLPSIADLLPNIAPLASAAPVAAAPPSAAAEPESNDSGNDKLISIKPPIIVADLAARMGLKAFLLMICRFPSGRRCGRPRGRPGTGSRWPRPRWPGARW